MSNQVIILIGPPGAGKDTQANLLADEYAMMQVPSSQIIRAKFAANPDDPIIQEQKKIFDAGKLNSPELVAKWIMEFVEPLAQKGKGVVFSGSPRTPHEARVEFSELLRLYGEKKVQVIHMQLSDAEARQRIADRLFCKANRHPYAASSGLTICPKDGSSLERRSLDDPSLQDVRFNEYHERTEPCLDIARESGIAFFNIDASQSPEAIHHTIIEIIERHRMPVSKN